VTHKTRRGAGFHAPGRFRLSLMRNFRETSMINSKVITITPEMATSFLERNTSNRPIRKPAVAFLKNSILRGEWITTHQGIAFDEHGVLIDGQHRLMAIASSGMSVEIMVTWGIERKAFSVIDTLTPRKLSDLLGIDRKSGEVVNLLTSICHYGNLTSKVTANQAKQISCIINPIHEKLPKTTLRGISNASTRSYICYLSIASDFGDYAVNLYGKLISKKLKELPPIGEALMRNALKGTLANGGCDAQIKAFSYADYVFDQKNKNKTRLITRDGYEVISEMHKNLRCFFVDGEPVSQEGQRETQPHIQPRECRT